MIIDFFIDLCAAVFHGRGIEPDLEDDTMDDVTPVVLPQTVEEMQSWLLEQADFFSSDGDYDNAEIAQHIAVQIGVMDLQIDRSPE